MSKCNIYSKAFIGFICFIATSAATPCPPTAISFVKKQGECWDYEQGHVGHSVSVIKDPHGIENFVDTLLPFCTADICGDGRHHTFCTTSGASVGDCIPGDAIENFEKIYAGKVDSVAIKVGALAVIPALINEVKEAFTSDERTIKLYEHGDHKGENIEIKSKKGQCINLPKEWQMRVSSYGAKEQARFYTGEDCTQHSVDACRDFTKANFWAKMNNLWGLLCSIDRMDNNTKSFKFE